VRRDWLKKKTSTIVVASLPTTSNAQSLGGAQPLLVTLAAAAISTATARVARVRCDRELDEEHAGNPEHCPRDDDRKRRPSNRRIAGDMDNNGRAA
jgi:hypothetical protein